MKMNPQGKLEMMKDGQKQRCVSIIQQNNPIKAELTRTDVAIIESPLISHGYKLLEWCTCDSFEIEMLVKIIRIGRSPSLKYTHTHILVMQEMLKHFKKITCQISMILTIKFHHRLLNHRLELACKTNSTLMSRRKKYFTNNNFKGTIMIPCLLSTSINAVSAVPLTVHSSTGAAKFPTWRYYAMHIQYQLAQ